MANRSPEEFFRKLSGEDLKRKGITEEQILKEAIRLLDLARLIRKRKGRKPSQKKLREQQVRRKVLRRTDELMGKPDPSAEILKDPREIFEDPKVESIPAWQVPKPKWKK